MVNLVRPQNEVLPSELTSLLPSNYDFNLQKSISLIKKHSFKRIALQLPDGLLKYTLILKKIFSKYVEEVFILGDVVYGACCVDDISAKELGAQFLIHYGHSCLISIKEMEIRVLYVFVDIRFDYHHLKDVFIKHFKNKEVALTSTVQFLSAVQFLKREIEDYNSKESEKIHLVIPKISPLSPGEVLGCTSPRFKSEFVFFIGDGRFHLESVMLSNPEKIFYKYCPSTKKLFLEKYDHKKVILQRKEAILLFKKAKNVGLIISSLGRQTNKSLLGNIIEELERKKYKVFLIKLQEIKNEALDKFPFLDAFVQLNCTRLSIDWGSWFGKPVVTPYELFNDTFEKYEMDFYALEGNNKWKNFNNQ